MSFLLELIKGTDAGRVRKINEDCVGIDEERGLFVLADGMGGHKAGEVASAMAVDILLSGLSQIQQTVKRSTAQKERFILDQLKSLIVACNQQIYEAGQQEEHRKGMGATVVAGLEYGDSLYYVHVGDSRLYCLRNEKLRQLTEDHTLLQEVKNESAVFGNTELETTVPGNIVTRALGAGPEVNPDCFFTPMQDGDIYLCCSDGLSDRLSDETIRQTIRASNTLLPVVAQLILQANEAGGEDNISVIIIEVSEGGVFSRLKKLWS